MPRLTFDRAVEYLMSRPEIALMVFDKVKDSGAIRYNHAMQVWEGVSREEDKL